MPKNITLLPKDKICWKGDIILTYDFKPHVKYPFMAKVFKRERGECVKTLYSVKRQDACTAFFNPTEIWHTFFKDVPENQRRCPYRKGQIFSIDLIIDTVIELSPPHQESDYLVRIQAGTNKPPDNVFLCAEVFCSAYQV